MTNSTGRLNAAQGLLALLVLSCGGSQIPDASKASQSIVVRNAGQAPRQRLRYAPPIGATERMELRFKFSIDTAFTNTVLEKGERKADLPAIRAVGHVEVTAIESNGDARIRGAIERAERIEDLQDPRLRRAIESEVDALERWRASWRMSPAGVISEVRIDPSSGVAPHQLANVIEAIRESSVVFPEEPIGVGATWERSSRITASGITWERNATYILRGLTDSTATVDVSVVGRAPSQALRVEPNATTRLTSGTANASGELVVPMRALVASGETRGSTETNLLIVNRRLRISSTVRTESHLVIKSLDAARAGDPAEVPAEGLSPNP